MSFSIIEFQDLIETHVKSQFPAYEVYDENILDDEKISNMGGRFRPFIVVRHQQLLRSPAEASFAGVRHDEYIGGFDIMVVAPSPRQSKVAVAMIQDELIGWKLPNGSYLNPEGGGMNFAIQDQNGRPHAYSSVAGFSYRLRENDPVSYSGS